MYRARSSSCRPVSTTDDNEQYKHECQQSAGDDYQPTHVRADVGELLLSRQFNRRRNGRCRAPAGAGGRGDQGCLSTWALLAKCRR